MSPQVSQRSFIPIGINVALPHIATDISGAKRVLFLRRSTPDGIAHFALKIFIANLNALGRPGVLRFLRQPLKADLGRLEADKKLG